MRRLPVRRRGSLHLGVCGLVVALTVVALFPARAAAATLTVCPSGCQHSTIADALAAANDGDTIRVAAGTYAGGFTIDKAIRLIGAGF
jgi:nitrous oxidase accessory protein NosD